MKIIEKLSHMIECELDDAEKYAKKALEYKEDNRQLSNVFIDLSMQEMNHMTALHNEVVRLIDEYRQKNGEPPKEMLAVYEYLHKKHIDHATKVRTMQNMYKGT